MTLAAEYGENAVGVVLSGTMNDGMRGAQIIHDVGGQTIVQSPGDADYSSMPMQVIERDHPTKVGDAKALGAWLVEHIGLLETV